MKFSEIKFGQKVHDSWWPTDVYGRVTKKFKSIVHIERHGMKWIYDKAHVQFLVRESARVK